MNDIINNYNIHSNNHRINTIDTNNFLYNIFINNSNIINNSHISTNSKNIIIYNNNHIGNGFRHLNYNNRIISNTVQNSSIAKEQRILNIKSIFYITLAIEFYNDARFLKIIDHRYDTRQRAAGGFKTGSFYNNYGKNTLEVTLPQIFNKLPIKLLNVQDKQRRKNFWYL